MYWAFQTLTTVGYGDCLPVNMTEFILNIIWMISGVIFYSILVASVTSNIQAEANNADKLASTLKSLEDFQKETNLDEELTVKIRQFLLNNQDDLFTKGDEENLLNELPISLKEEVLYYQHGKLVENIHLF
jgi:ABC-type siderophore export system fused ATPase/permease subunit